MRHLAAGLGLGVLLLAGCNHFAFLKSNSPDVPGMQVTSATPTAADLVALLNDNARKVQGLECRGVDMDCTQGMQSVSLRAVMVCQKLAPASGGPQPAVPQGHANFRMSAKVMGNTAVDIGSNSQEFWYWISKADPPYLYHCSYQDFATGRVSMPFPFQPDWIIEALGIAEYDPSKAYEVTMPRAGTIELAERALSPQGQPVRKVTILTRTQNQIYVSAHVLRDANNREICSAKVSELQRDAATGAILPRIVHLTWPAQRMSMKMKLDELITNPQLPPQRVTALFTRPVLQDVPSYNLARGFDQPLRRAGGFYGSR
jgi:hypothetical protein